jgi:hypothetical protein
MQVFVVPNPSATDVGWLPGAIFHYDFVVDESTVSKRIFHLPLR